MIVLEVAILVVEARHAMVDVEANVQVAVDAEEHVEENVLAVAVMTVVLDVATIVREHAIQDVKMLVVVLHAQQLAEQHALDLLAPRQEIQIKMEANKIYGNSK